MIGGIYCEIPLRRFYNRKKFYSVRSKLHKLVGGNVQYLFDEKELDYAILGVLNSLIREHFTQRRNPGYHDQTETLKNSYGYAVYNLDKSKSPVLRQQPNFAKDSTGTFERFVDTYEPLTTYGWMILLCVTAPYAARVESLGNYPNGAFPGYGLKVLSPLVNGLAQRIRESLERKDSTTQYGYILNSETFGTVGERLTLQQYNSNLGI